MQTFAHAYNNKSARKVRPMPHLPKLEATEANLDVALLDMMELDDYLALLKNKTDANWKELWRETCSMINQLKAARELLSIGANLICNRITRKILDRLVEVTHTLLNAERVVILELDPTGRELVVTHAREERVIGIRIPATTGIEGDVLSTRVCANVTDATLDTRYAPSLDVKTGNKTRSIVCAPIMSDGQVIGVVQAFNKLAVKTRVSRDFSALSFTQNESLLLGFIATNIGLALKQLSMTHTLSSQVMYGGVPDPQRTGDGTLARKLKYLEGDKSLQGLIESAYQKLDAERVSIFTYSATTKSLICAVSEDIKGFSIPHDKGFAGLAFTAMRLINVPDTKTDERHNKDVDKSVGFVTRNLLCAPIISQDGVALGVIQAVNKKSGPNFTYVDEENINEVCKMMVSLLKEKTEVVDRKIFESSGDEAGTFSSSALPPVQSVTLARCIGNMSLAGSMSELVAETESTIKINTQLDTVIVCILDGDRVFRIPPLKRLQKASADADEPGEMQQWKLTDVNFHLKQALQFSTTVDFHASSDDLGVVMPGLHLQQAIIIPIASKAYPFHPGNCLVIAGHNSPQHIDIAPAKEILDIVGEYFGHAVNALSERCIYEENIKLMRHQFNLLNTSLGAVSDYVIILNDEGQFLGCNKRVEDLLGLQVMSGEGSESTGTGVTSSAAAAGTASSSSSPGVAGAAAGMRVMEGMHYSQWINAGNSPELVRDICNAVLRGESRSADSARLTSPVYPEGVSVNYQVTAVENPEVRDRLTSPQQTPSAAATPSAAGGAGSAFTFSSGSLPEAETTPSRIIVVVIHLNTKKVIGLDEAVPSMTPTKSQQTLDVSSASNAVDTANAILSAIRANFVLDKEVEDNLKEIMNSLRNTSRRMSISQQNFSAINMALGQLNLQLVSPEVTLPKDMFEWQFDVLKIFDKFLLCNIIGRYFQVLFNLEELNVDDTTLARYITEVGKHYHDRPFHNLQHATCVSHFTFMLIRETKAPENLKMHQVFGILVSAVVHDVDHPGNTNLFEINSGSELALRYNDQSVLENHHCSTAFKIMRNPTMQILSRMPKPVAVEIRKTIISCVMATDMAVHFDLIEETKKRAVEGWKFEEAKDQALLGKILLHAADLSNPVRPFHMTRQWADRISIEFNDQVAREQALGMPVLGFMMTPDEKAFCKNEAGFASFVVAPMWRAIALLYPNLGFLVEQLDSNLLTWKGRLEKLQAEEQAAQGNS